MDVSIGYTEGEPYTFKRESADGARGVLAIAANRVGNGTARWAVVIGAGVDPREVAQEVAELAEPDFVPNFRGGVSK